MRLVARLKGGVGNQLFIYAAAYAFSRMFGYKLCMDGKSGFIRDTYNRVYKLDSFQIEWTLMSGKAVLYFALRKLSQSLSMLFFPDAHEVTENDSKVFKPFQLSHPFPSLIFFDGLWQSPKYFRNYRSEIVRELAFKNADKFRTNPLFDLIVSSNSVAIHVRKMQYNNPLNLNYYFQAMALLESKLEKVTYFVFSDDLGWCKRNFESGSNLFFIEYTGQTDIEDLFLMTQCKHFIIANSTYSWWGAWLSTGSEKIVIAPKEFKMNSEPYDEGWIEI